MVVEKFLVWPLSQLLHNFLAGGCQLLAVACAKRRRTPTRVAELVTRDVLINDAACVGVCARSKGRQRNVRFASCWKIAPVVSGRAAGVVSSCSIRPVRCSLSGPSFRVLRHWSHHWSRVWTTASGLGPWRACSIALHPERSCHSPPLRTLAYGTFERWPSTSIGGCGWVMTAACSCWDLEPRDCLPHRHLANCVRAALDCYNNVTATSDRQRRCVHDDSGGWADRPASTCSGDANGVTIPWRIDTFPDVESVALHEFGHGLSQLHFGQAFLTNANDKVHFAPLAVMNAGSDRVSQQLLGADVAGHCSIWGSWPNK